MVATRKEKERKNTVKYRSGIMYLTKIRKLYKTQGILSKITRELKVKRSSKFKS